MLGDERWASCLGFEDYEVSDRGNVRSWKTCNGRGRRLSPVPMKAFTTKLCGHQVVSFWKNGKQSPFYIHRLVWEAFVGPIPDGMSVCHNNGVAGDNKISNLRVDTQAANMRDMHQHRPGFIPALIESNRARRGDLHPRSIKRAQVASMRMLRAHGAQYCDIADWFDVDRNVASNAVRGVGRFAEL
jgi:hypothetical protein